MKPLADLVVSKRRVLFVFTCFRVFVLSWLILPHALSTFQSNLAARGEGLAAFDGRCIPAGCVAPPSNTPGILGRRALLAGRLARLGATPDFHHGLLAISHQLFAKARSG